MTRDERKAKNRAHKPYWVLVGRKRGYMFSSRQLLPFTRYDKTAKGDKAACEAERDTFKADPKYKGYEWRIVDSAGAYPHPLYRK